ncbi:MAG: alpha/beta hydrolase [Actinomycetota bacterium]|nr:alpha/beta hydrolase [Actinomycetota bacterium]
MTDRREAVTDRTGGSRETIVLVHGIPGSSRIWRGVKERLEPDFRVIAPDLLGFGTSPEPEPGPDGVWADAQARALAARLDDEGIERATLVGHDYGGPVSLALAALRPELPERLVLCATNTFPDVPIPLPIRAVTWPVVGDLAARVLFSGPSLRKLAGDDLVGDAREQRTTRTIFTTALRELETRYAPIERSLRTIRAPALVVWAGKDPFFETEQGRRTAEALPDGRLLLYEDCGHYVPAEQPGRLAADIRAFVREPVTAA